MNSPATLDSPPAPAAHSLKCENCGAGVTLPENQRTLVCPFCASAHVVEGALGDTGPAPELAIPHSQGEKLARAALLHWQRGLGFFRHAGVRQAKLEDFRGIYLPGVLYSAVARARYSAVIAEEYYETETYTVTVNGKRQTRTRTVKKHEWIPLHGRYDGYATDIVVSATRAIGNEELERIEPFDFRDLRRYAPGLVAGWIVEAATRDPEEALALARKELADGVQARLARFMPGESHRELQASTEVERESHALALFPVWVLALRYAEDQPPLRVLINGQTGKVGAKVPWSWPRIVGAALLGAAAIGALVAFFSGAFQ